MGKKKTTIVPVGPYHPLQEEPEFFKLHVEGERVVGLDIELGYNHRGVEKLSESKDYEETVFLEPGQQVDGTLDASDSLTTGTDARDGPSLDCMLIESARG